jgi:flagellar basal-body rod protein FlgB
MNISSVITDNIAELLSKILEFTQRRRDVIAANILNVNEPGYEPKDLDVDEFADLMTQAISEHLHSRRLLLCDGRHTHFTENGCFEAIPIVDEKAGRLLAADSKTYLKDQMAKLFENVLNTRFAAELLEQKQYPSSSPRFF